MILLCLNYFLNDDGQIKYDERAIQSMNDAQKQEYSQNLDKVSEIFNKYTFFENASQCNSLSQAVSNGKSNCLDEVILGKQGIIRF